MKSGGPAAATTKDNEGERWSQQCGWDGCWTDVRAVDFAHTRKQNAYGLNID